MQSLLASDDIKSTALVAGACVAGFLLAWPSPAVVRLVFVAVATFGVTMCLLNKHQTSEDTSHRDDILATSLFKDRQREERPRNGPFATLVHPEVCAAVASLSKISKPGRRAAVHAVVAATENVLRVYHRLLAAPMSACTHPKSCMDDLREHTNIALDALQCLKMQTGSRGEASMIAAAAERALRGLFVRFRQIASNKHKSPELHGAPYAFDPSDDHHFVR